MALRCWNGLGACIGLATDRIVTNAATRFVCGGAQSELLLSERGSNP